jgi:ribosomal protein S18 acetylase RimI-like enzyme
MSLDRPIWNALATRQAALAERRGSAVRFDPAYTVLAALESPSDFGDLVGMLQPGEVTGLLFDDEPVIPPELVRVDCLPVAQMLRTRHVEWPSLPHLELGASDAAEMLDLARRTRPGPFSTRTHELGTFVGVREAGKLVAMAGQRMRLPGLTEVSGVCTDPSALGRGLAGALIAELLRRIDATGDEAFLHVRADNQRAIALYERLGFVQRHVFAYLVVQRRESAR